MSEAQHRKSATSAAHEKADSPEPSWFLDAANDQTHGFLTARYRHTLRQDGQPRHHHDNIEDFESAYEIFDPSSARRSRTARRTIRQPVEPSTNATRRSRWIYGLAALGAMVFGGAAGYGVSQFDDIKQRMAALQTAGWTPQSAAVTAGAQIQTADNEAPAKKSIATATLQVADAAGRSNIPIPLILRAEPPAAQSDLLLKISGLPETAYLTAGHKDTRQVWSLSLGDLKDVKLVVPEAGKPKIDLAVAAFEPRTGELLAPVKTMTIAIADAKIEPTSAPPPTALPANPGGPAQLSAIPAPVSTGTGLIAKASRDLVLQGNTLLEAGDADGARELYQKAYASGDATASYGIARSFDPLIHAQYKVNNGQPDGTRAVEWYERAALAGQTDALAAIARLKVKP